jgi:hypothetical protein
VPAVTHGHTRALDPAPDLLLECGQVISGRRIRHQQLTLGRCPGQASFSDAAAVPPPFTLTRQTLDGHCVFFVEHRHQHRRAGALLQTREHPASAVAKLQVPGLS